MNDQLVGRTLRARRHRRGWRQSDLAAAAGVARSVIDFPVVSFGDYSMPIMLGSSTGWTRCV